MNIQSMTDVIATLPPDREALLRQLIDEVLTANTQFNLTAIRDPNEAWTKHIVDSLQGLATGCFEGKRRVIDVGSGAGFPGLPLAIGRPKLTVTLLEATRKKCTFLETVSAKLNLTTNIVNTRAEEAGQDRAHREKYDVATARAVGSLSEVAELCLPLVKVGGHVVLWRGQKARDEISLSRRALETLGGTLASIVPYRLPHQGLDFHLVVVKKVSPTPPAFPRRSGMPKQKPL